MKTTPLLFNADMVNALLDGRKTMTRRIVKGKSVKVTHLQPCIGRPHVYDSITNKEILYPYGKKGDLIWVRETCKAKELTDKEAEILFSEGMAGKIHDFLVDKFIEEEACRTLELRINDWFATVTPEKILNVYLELKPNYD
jgi:hypothetical protein